MTYAAVVLMAAFAAAVQTAVGMGFALVLSPVLLVALAPKAAIVTVTVLGLSVNVLTVLRGGRKLNISWNEVAPILLAAVPGSIGGLALLQVLSKPTIETAVGAMVVLLAAARILRAGAPLTVPVAPGRLAVGVLAGALSTASGIYGPPLAIWLSGRDLSPTAIRDSLAAIFLGTGAITVVTLLPGLGSVHVPLVVLAGGLVAVGIGFRVGNHLHLRATEDHLRRGLSLVILLTGIAALLSGLGVL